MKLLLIAIRTPIILILLTFSFVKLFPFDEVYPINSIKMIFVWALIYFYAGWCLFSRYSRSIPVIATAGFSLFAFDHIVLAGGYFLIEGLIDGEILASNLEAFIGVLFSFIIFSPIVICIVVIGGLFSRFMNGNSKQRFWVNNRSR